MNAIFSLRNNRAWPLTLISAVLALMAWSATVHAATYVGATTSYGWIAPANDADVSFTGTCSTGGSGSLDDAISPAITLPFTFTYGGAARTTVQISSNGRLQFGGNSICNSPIVPSSSLPNTMAPANGIDLDLRPTGSGGSTSCLATDAAPNTCYARYGMSGTAPNRKFVVSFVGVPTYQKASPRNTFQIILNEDGTFVYQYNTLYTNATPAWELSTTDYGTLSSVASSSGAARLFSLAPKPALLANYTLDQGTTSWSDSSGAGAGNATAIGAATSAPAPTTTPPISPALGVCTGANIPPNTAAGTISAVGVPFTLGTHTTLKSAGSISFWWKAETAWNSGTAAQILDATTGSTSQVFALTRLTSGKLYWRFYDSSGRSRSITTATSFTYAANNWHYITLTWDFPGASAQLLVDGTLAGSTTLTTSRTLNSSIGSPYFGDNRSGTLGTNGTGNSAAGVIDEIRIYGGALSSAYVASDMNTYKTARACTTTFDHIRLEHDGQGSNCAPETIKVIACADPACANFYTAGVSNINLSATPSTGVTWTPVTASIPAGSSSATATIAVPGAATVTLGTSGTTIPATANATDCKNAGTGALSCTLVFSTSLGFNIPDHVAGTPQTASICGTPAFAGTARMVKFSTTYINPTTGTLSGKIIASSTGNADCTTGYTTTSNSSTAPTPLSLNFSSGAIPTAQVTFCYPDVGQVKLEACYDGTSTSTACGGGSLLLGTAYFVAKPYNFTVSGTGIPGTSSPTGTIFNKAGQSFTASVTARNKLGNLTPNFGKEATAEGVVLTAAVVAPSGGNDGTLTCNASTTSDCIINGGKFHVGTGDPNAGIATLTDFAWDEVGAMKLTPRVADGNYLGAGQIAPLAADATSGVIGRFTPDHYSPVDGSYTLLARSGRSGCWTTGGSSTGDIAAGSNVFTVTGAALTTAPAAGDSVVVVGAGAGGADLRTTVVGFTDPDITLGSTAGTAVTGANIFQRFGYSYMAEGMQLGFGLEARNSAGNVTTNYSDLDAGGNPGFSRFSATASNVIATGTDSWGLAMVGEAPFTALSGRAAAFSGTTPTMSWADGEGVFTATVNLDHPAPAALPDGPYPWLALGILPTDKDGVTLGSTDKDLATLVSGTKDRARVGVANVRYGRAKLTNAYGSDLLPLSIPATVQYYNGSNWVTSADDNCTPLSRDTTIAHPTAELVPAATNPPTVANATGGTVTINGLVTIKLNTPNPRGNATLTWPVKPYMQFPWAGAANGFVDPSAIANFGSYKAPYIYMRERY